MSESEKKVQTESSAAANNGLDKQELEEVSGGAGWCPGQYILYFLPDYYPAETSK